jgi:uncharacterized protein
MAYYPPEYIDYLVHFHAERDYFECHEVMEEFWKEHPEDPLSDIYVGLIQVAVSMYHYRRGNLGGSMKMLQSAIKRLYDPRVVKLGLDREALHCQLLKQQDRLLNAQLPYEDVNLPLIDEQLAESCKQASKARGLVWEAPSPMGDTYLLNKHKLRDRSRVIAEREKQLNERKVNRAKRVD